MPIQQFKINEVSLAMLAKLSLVLFTICQSSPPLVMSRGRNLVKV